MSEGTCPLNHFNNIRGFKMTYLFTNQKRNQKGFSLIELMVVVVIIGLLAAIAVPNFRQFQRRAVQTEAKTLTSGVYTAQIAYASEHGFGSPNIDQIGFSPEGVIQYRVGFSQNTPTAGTNYNLTTRPTGYRGPAARNINDIDTFVLCDSTMVQDVSWHQV